MVIKNVNLEIVCGVTSKVELRVQFRTICLTKWLSPESQTWESHP